MSHEIDDATLTAYALGELSPEATAKVEAYLESNPAARDTVTAIRATAVELQAALAVEPATSLTLPQRAAILNATTTVTGGANKGRPAFYRRPTTIAAAASIVLAATVAVSVMTYNEQRAPNGHSYLAHQQPAYSLGAPPSNMVITREGEIAAAPAAREPGAVPNTGMAVGAPPPQRGVRTDVQTQANVSDDSTLLLGGQTLAGVVEGAEVGGIPNPGNSGQQQPQQLAWRPSLASAGPPPALAAGRPNPSDSKFSVNQHPRMAIAADEMFRLESPPNGWIADGLKETVRHDGSFNTESYARIHDHPFLAAAQNPLSTFSIDVDTASYSNVRRFLNDGQLPPADAVRIEELVNYFPYDYPQPDGDAPFAANVEIAATPWNPAHRLVRVALRGKDASQDKAIKETPKNLVFLIDVSGSMQSQNKLPLLKESMKMLVRELNAQDKVTIAVYAGSSGLVLPPTTVGTKTDGSVIDRANRLWNEKYQPKIVTINGQPANQKQVESDFLDEVKRLPAEASAGRDAILAAIDRLEAGGSTNGAAGITLAYEQAASAFIKNGVNRVILCTDGDFNVGVTNEGDLTRMIEEKAKSGVFLSVLGYGMGNVKDSTMEKLADKGNGNYAYIDTLAEAKKTLVEQMNGTLVTIAKDVKIQVEFNPAKVDSYRLIGYENRMLAKEDFNDDKKDAGEIGAGHTVTALYEVVPVGVKPPTTLPGVDPLKYQPQVDASKPVAGGDELLTLKLRYKAPDAPLEQGTSKLLQFPVTDAGHAFATASTDFKFATAVAAFGMVLRDSPHKGDATLGHVLKIATSAKGEDKNGYRGEFIQLVMQAVILKDQ
ncbi:MAG TPA: von Willebrand factor type A domain-containing protein [Tepidisphaeraceae bacterium]|nr:von Willebrand factor type A domain-containing protein [Tepidisphaeraceae bacterium]